MTLQSRGSQEEPKGVLPTEGISEVQGKGKRARLPRGAARRSIRPHVHSHPLEVRRKAVRLYLEEGFPPQLVAREIGVGRSTLSKWVKLYRDHGEAGLRQFPDILRFLRAAFIRESGEALIRKHAGKGHLFTSEGYGEYAADPLERMTNPHLQDTVERVGRDPQRRRGWDDRLVGTVRVALQAGLVPRRYALGAAAALAMLDPSFLRSETPAKAWLEPLWRQVPAAREEQGTVLGLIEDGRGHLKRWCESKFQNLEGFFPQNN